MATTGTFTLFDSVTLWIGDGTEIAKASNTVKMVLCTSAEALTASGFSLYSDLAHELPTGGGYTAGGISLTGVALNRSGGLSSWFFTGPTPKWHATSGGIPAWRYFVLYVSGTLNGHVNPLIGFALGDFRNIDIASSSPGAALDVFGASAFTISQQSAAPISPPLVLSASEYLWSDTHDTSGWAPDAATYSRSAYYLGTFPGWYAENAAAWQNYGGDWWDSTVTAQGATPYATTTVIDDNTTKPIDFTSTAMTSLVQQWLAGTAPFPNLGFILVANTNNIHWYTSRGTTPPTMTITANAVDTVFACTRSIGLDSSTSSSLELATNQQTSTSPVGRLLVYFDLSGSTINPSQVTAAKITVTTYSQFGNQNVSVYAVRNANDPAVGTPATTFGVAENYPLDVGLENDPAVLFCQHFPSIAQMQADWLCAQAAPSIGSFSNSLVFANANDPTTGFTKLGNLYNAIQVVYTPNFASAYEAYWSTWRGTGSQRLPGKTYGVPPDELYLRYYFLLAGSGSNAWIPQPQSGKFPGFDGRYIAASPPNGVTALPGMGRGNSGSGADGITGFSARGSYSSQPPTGAPNQNLYWLGPPGDVYDLYTGYGSVFGHGVYAETNHYLTSFRHNEWHCFELHIKLNSVTNPTQAPRVVTSLTQTGGTATAVLQNSETDFSVFTNGATWSIGGSATAQYGGPHIITVVPDGGQNKTFSFPVDPATPSPAVLSTAYFCAVPSQANADGIVETFSDGRLITSTTTGKFRHSAICADGVTHFGIDSAWFPFYHGGQLNPSRNFSVYISEVVVATSYIGPMVNTTPFTIPAWMKIGGNIAPLLQWIQPANSAMTNMASSEVLKLANAGYCNTDGSQLQGADGWGRGFGATHGDPFQGVFGDSGATFRKAGSTFVFFGGGGAGAWAGNDLRICSLEADAPTWTIYGLPTQSNVSGGVFFQPPGPWARGTPGAPFQYMQDGITPNARHSYRGPQFHNGMDKFFSMGCDNTWEIDSGIFTNVDSYDWTNKAWQPPSSNVDGTTVSGWRNAPQNHSTNNNIRLKDPTTEHIYWATATSIYEFDPTTNTWPRRCYNSASRSDVQYGPAAINPNYTANGSVGLMFVLGILNNAFRPMVYEMHTGADSWVLTPVGTSAPWFANLASGSQSKWITGGSYGASMQSGLIYCPDRNSFMMYQNDGLIWEITQGSDISQWNINQLNLTGTAPAPQGVTPGGTDGSNVRCNGHMQYVPNLKGVALYLQSNWNVFFFRTG